MKIILLSMHIDQSLGVLYSMLNLIALNFFGGEICQNIQMTEEMEHLWEVPETTATATKWMGKTIFFFWAEAAKTKLF